MTIIFLFMFVLIFFYRFRFYYKFAYWISCSCVSTIFEVNKFKTDWFLLHFIAQIINVQMMDESYLFYSTNRRFTLRTGSSRSGWLNQNDLRKTIAKDSRGCGDCFEHQPPLLPLGYARVQLIAKQTYKLYSYPNTSLSCTAEVVNKVPIPNGKKEQDFKNKHDELRFISNYG